VLAYRDFPLQQIHPQTQMAAEASRCAAEQGRFWEYHDLLFANPGKLDKAAQIEHARSLMSGDGLPDKNSSSSNCFHSPQASQQLPNARGLRSCSSLSFTCTLWIASTGA